MAMPTMTFRTLLDQEAETYFWIRSDTIFRPSEFFSEIIYYYLLKLEDSHQKFKVHQWEGKTLPENLMFIGYNHKKICFVQDPVTAIATDFENQRAQDYKDLAKLIQLAQGWYVLPQISEKNCPELFNFMELLKSSRGKELSLKKHYSLWGCSRRFKFFLDFQTRYVQDQFKKYFDDNVKLWKRIDFGKEYSEGFVAKLVDEPLLRTVYFYEYSTPYENTLADLVRFSRNLTAHYSKDKSGNPQTMRLVEWKLFVRFPFLMIAICEVLASMNMFDQFAD